MKNNIVIIFVLFCNLLLCSCIAGNNSDINSSLENLNTDTDNKVLILPPVFPDDPSAIKFSIQREYPENNLNFNLVKNYKGIKLNAYNGMFGSYGEENIFQKEIRIEENGNDFKVTITPLKDFLNRLKEEIESLSDDGDDEFADFILKYKFNFDSKENALYFLENYNEYIPNNYELKSVQETTNGIEYKYDSVITEPISVYSSNTIPSKSYTVTFDKLKEKFPNELKDIECVKNCSKNSLQPKFSYKGEGEYSLAQLRNLNDGEFKNLTQSGKNFSYTKYEENRIYNDPKLLGLQNNSDIKEEKLIKNELILALLGTGANLTYSDYGYWKEKGYYKSVIDESISERESITMPLIGGVYSLEKFENDLDTKTTFIGKVVANVKKLNEDNITLFGNISYTIDKNKTEENGMKTFNAEFSNWYNIDISSTGNGYADFTFSKSATMDETLPIVYPSNLDGEKKGYIKDTKYYGNMNDLESVGVLEYIDKFNTDLTLAYGSKKEN